MTYRVTGNGNTMQKQPVAIVRAENMARARGQAFLATDRAEICGVAARRAQRAESCAAKLGCSAFFDDFRRLDDARPDAVLIKIPHRVQDHVSLLALEAGYDLLVGGCLSSSTETGRGIVELVGQEQPDRGSRVPAPVRPCLGGDPAPGSVKGTGRAGDGRDHGSVEPGLRTGGTVTRRRAGGCP